MFLSRNKKNNVYPFKPQFYYIKVEFKGSNLYRHVFVMKSRIKWTAIPDTRTDKIHSDVDIPAVLSACFGALVKYPRNTAIMKRNLHDASKGEVRNI